MFHVSCIQLIIVRAAPVYGTYIALLSFNVYVCKYKKSIYLSLSLKIHLKIRNLADIYLPSLSSLMSSIQRELILVVVRLQDKLLHITTLPSLSGGAAM